MAEFTGKEIARAVYTNEAHDTIMVEYYNGKVLDDGSRVLIPVYISSDPNATYLKELFAEGYDFERIQRETVINNQQQLMAWRQMVKAEAAIEIAKVKRDYEKKYDRLISNSGVINKQTLLSAVIESNQTEEILFRTKLEMFDLLEVKKSTSKDIKRKIRNAKSLLELFGILNDIMKTQNDTTPAK